MIEFGETHSVQLERKPGLDEHAAGIRRGLELSKNLHIEFLSLSLSSSLLSGTLPRQIALKAMACMSPPLKSSDSANKGQETVGKWQWKKGDVVVDYDQATSLLIETAYQKNSRAIVAFTINSITYQVYLEFFKQVQLNSKNKPVCIQRVSPDGQIHYKSVILRAKSSNSAEDSVTSHQGESTSSSPIGTLFQTLTSTDFVASLFIALSYVSRLLTKRVFPDQSLQRCTVTRNLWTANGAHKSASSGTP